MLSDSPRIPIANSEHVNAGKLWHLRRHVFTWPTNREMCSIGIRRHGGTTFGLPSRSESLQVSATALARVLVGNCRTDALVELLGEDRCRLGSDDNFAW
jgi:hypothetical protein